MKRIFSLCLALLMLVSAVPMAMAADTDYSNGTQITLVGSQEQASYTVTVPAELQPGQSGTVSASGNWSSKQTLKVTAPSSVQLTYGTQTMDVGITFAGIEKVGSDTAASSTTATVAVADASVLFGTWTGVLNYTVEMVEKAAMYSYNGVELPALPEWDKEQYPYAVIEEYNIGPTMYYSLFLCSDMPINLDGYEYYDYILPAIRYFGVEEGAETWGDPELLSEEDGSGPWSDEGEHDENGRYWFGGSDPIWANFDFYYTDYEGHEGEIYIAASDPIPVEEVPTVAMYSYNGTELPALPEWDKEAYPYALISAFYGSSTNPQHYLFTAWSEAVHVYNDTLYTDSYEDCLIVAFEVENDVWNYLYESEYHSMPNYQIVWSHFDLLNSDGTVYLAASDPVPAYE